MHAKEITKVYAPDNVYAYLLCDTTLNSKKLGVCDVCDDYATGMHIQAELVQRVGRWQTTKTNYGHMECLRKQRKEGGKTTEMTTLTVDQNVWTVE